MRLSGSLNQTILEHGEVLLGPALSENLFNKLNAQNVLLHFKVIYEACMPCGKEKA